MRQKRSLNEDGHDHPRAEWMIHVAWSQKVASPCCRARGRASSGCDFREIKFVRSQQRQLEGDQRHIRHIAHQVGFIKMTVIDQDHVPKEHASDRKRKAEEAELEIDLNAPEPPSKKALRKAKKARPVPENVLDSPSTADERGTKFGAHGDGPETRKRSEHGVWIGNLSFGISKNDLLEFLTGDPAHVITRDQITRIHLPLGPPKNGKVQNKGFAYVDFGSPISVLVALELSETLLNGRRVLIKDAKNYDGRPQTAQDKQSISGNPPGKRLFIGNLDFETTTQDLENHFGACGTIVNTHIATFEDSGKCKGFAWIEFENVASAQAAMRGWLETDAPTDADPAMAKASKKRIWLHKLGGRKLRMEYAEDPTTRYKKRFGKDAQAATPENGGDEVNPRPKKPDNNSQEDKRNHVSGHLQSATNIEPPDTRTKRRNSGGGGGGGGGGSGGQQLRYATDTVQRLKGVMVKSQGRKTVFE